MTENWNFLRRLDSPKASIIFLPSTLTGSSSVKETRNMIKYFTPNEQALINILKTHPQSTISEMKMYIGLRKRNEVPHALNGLQIKGVLTHTDDKPPRYSFSDTSSQF